MANDLEELTNDRDYWQRVRREFDWVFWIIVGPLLLGVLIFLLTGLAIF